MYGVTTPKVGYSGMTFTQHKSREEGWARAYVFTGGTFLFMFLSPMKHATFEWKPCENLVKTF